MAGQSPVDAQAYIAGEIEKARLWSHRGQRMWSFMTHGSTITVIILSACAAVLAQHSGNLESLHLNYPAKNIATVLSLLVAIITSIQTKIAFERKWIANRMTQSALSQLTVDSNMALVPPAQLAQAYKEVLEKHNKAIAGAS